MRMDIHYRFYLFKNKKNNPYSKEWEKIWQDLSSR